MAKGGTCPAGRAGVRELGREVRSSKEHDASPNGTEELSSNNSSGQQDLPVNQAGPPWLCEALGGALVEEQGGGSLGSYLCSLCTFTVSGQNCVGVDRAWEQQPKGMLFPSSLETGI